MEILLIIVSLLVPLCAEKIDAETPRYELRPQRYALPQILSAMLDYRAVLF